MSETPYARRGSGKIDGGISVRNGAVTGEARVGEAPNVFGGTGRGVDHFTAPAFREHQREAIEEIDAAFQQGYRFVFLNAPTGSGKSIIGRAIAFEAGDTHILTGQKILQDQYAREFDDMFIMKGRGEYKSKWEVDPDTGEPLNTTCANCPCQRKRAHKIASCPYGEAKKAAQKAPVTVHNFDSFYYQGYLSHSFSPRQLMIIDEAHNLEEKYLNFMEFTLSSYGRPELVIPEYSDIDDYDRLVRSELEYVRRQIKTLDAVRGGDQFGLEPDQVRELEDLTRLEHRLGRYVLNRDRGGSVEYVFEYEDKGAYQRVTFRPVFVGSFVRESLFPMAQRFLMMSATLLDKDLFARSIGASPDEVYFIDLPSTFPAKNRPIVFRPVGSMKYSERENTLPLLATEVQAILDRYPDRKGIIQTHNEKTAKYLRSVLKDERLTFNKDFSSPQEMLEVHRKKPGSFIVASGLREGLDLSGDLSKVQVFCKVPYPSLGDKRVKRKMDIDKSWYGYMTTLMFVQALGRSVRSKSEKAITYLLDSDFKRFYGMNKRFIPKYIREAIVWR
jgi:Rad3-related DNA helicase